MDKENQLDNENLEIRLLLEAIFIKYGYDFRHYGKAHIKRRIVHRLTTSGLNNISALTHLVIHDKNYYQTLLQDLSINVTEMFRDPAFYVAIRKHVIPVLKTYPFIKIWHAGCATGEEVYSMAILLTEEGLYKRAQIYATDFNPLVIKKAKDGIFTIEKIKEYTFNYQKSGGTATFSDYYTAKYDSVIMDNELKKNLVFSDHNLVTDGAFGEMNMIICRNVLIYFDKNLQNQVIRLFSDSLQAGSYLCLGSKETVRFTDFADHFEEIDEKEKIFKKKYME